LKVEYSLCRWAGGMPESAGESSLRVGFRHPEMMRNTLFNDYTTLSTVKTILGKIEIDLNQSTLARYISYYLLLYDHA